jgi:hypothetical protein
VGVVDRRLRGLGVCAGFGFMAGELPNSFVKRQLGIRPGERYASSLALGCSS